MKMTFPGRCVAPRLGRLTGCAAILILSATAASARDPLKQPFHEDSIWNMPLGNSATYVPAGIGVPDQFYFDSDYFVKTATSDPFKDFYQADYWSSRSTGTLWKGKFRVPDSFVLGDATSTDTPNNCSAFLDPDGRTLRQLNATTRPSSGSNIWGYVYENQNLYRKGLYGAHGGSGLSSIGGTLRSGELTDSNPIKHVLKFDVNEQFLSYVGATPGYRWPAYTTDSNASSSYHGTVNAMTMGSLLAIKSTETESSLGLETSAGMKLFRALRDYGAYACDTSGWNAFYFCAEPAVKGELQTQLGYDPQGNGNTAFFRDMKRLIAKMCVVDDNSATNVGGAGTRRVAKADSIGYPAPLTALSRSGWNAWGLNNTGNILDGNMGTSATSSGNQSNGGQILTLDMGAPRTFNRIDLETAIGGDESKYPRHIVVYGSNDTSGWGDWLGEFNGDSLTEGETELWFNSSITKRYLTFQQTGTASVGWSIAELNVFDDFNATSSAGPNLVTNPGFEAEQYNNQTPSGWNEWSGVNYNAGFTESYGGSHSGSYHGTHWSPNAYNMYTYQSIGGLVNGLYTLRCWARSTGGQNQCYLEAKGFGGNAVAANLPVSGTYQLVEIKNISVTNGQCTIGIWSDANANNFCYYDDFEFFKQ